MFARGAKADEAQAAGADIVGAEDLVGVVNGGEINFDRCIATPDMMPLVGRLGKVLGPRGLMPNPKVGTVTMDVDRRGQRLQGRRGRVPRRKGRHHPGFGRQGLVRRSASSPKTSAPFVDAVAKAKPAGSKGTYLQRAAISSTMGPGVKLDLSTIVTASAVGT